MRAETESLICPSCNIIIELTKEEAVLASGKYHLQKKQNDTGQNDEKLMTSLELVEDNSRAEQGNQSNKILYDQVTSPIMIEDENDDNDDNWSNSVDNR